MGQNIALSSKIFRENSHKMSYSNSSRWPRRIKIGRTFVKNAHTTSKQAGRLEWGLLTPR